MARMIWSRCFLLGCILNYASNVAAETVADKPAQLMRSVPHSAMDARAHGANLMSAGGASAENLESESEQSTRRVLASLQDASVSQLHDEFKRISADDRKHASTLREGILLRQKLKDDIIGLIGRLDQENRRISKLLPKGILSEKTTNAEQKHTASQARHHHHHHHEALKTKRKEEHSREDEPEDKASSEDEDEPGDANSLAELASQMEATPLDHSSLDQDVENGRVATAAHVDSILSYIHHLRKRDDAHLVALNNNAHLRQKIKTSVERRIKEQQSELSEFNQEAALPEKDSGDDSADDSEDK